MATRTKSKPRTNRKRTASKAPKAAAPSPKAVSTTAPPTNGKSNGNGNGHSRKPAAPTSRPSFTHEDVAMRAFEIWQERGRPVGEEREHWLEAERELKNGSNN